MVSPSAANTISLEEFQQRLIALCVQSGNRGLPRKQRDRHIILKSVVLTFDRTLHYTETEVNQKIKRWFKHVGSRITLDHVVLRRVLVDEEFLGRSQDGSRYWVATISRKQIPFATTVEEVDVVELVAQGKQRIEQRKYLKRRVTPDR